MNLKKAFLFILPFILVLFSLSSGQSPRTIRIGVVIDGPWGEDYEMLRSIKREIIELTAGEFNVQFPANKTLQANWTLIEIRRIINQLLVDPEVDIIITLGSISSNDVCHHREFSKPVIAPYIMDVEFQGLFVENGTSGIKNLNYVSVPSTFKRDMGIFKDIVLFKNLAILINKYLLDAFPDLEQSGKKLFDDLDLEVQTVGMGLSIQEGLDQLSEDIEAIYVLPLPHLSDEEHRMLADELIHRKLPSFSYTGAERVKQGILVGLNKDVVNRISRRVALNIQRILSGEKPESIPVAISLKQQLTINEVTSKALGIFPSWAVITEAELIGQDKRQIERKLDLYKVVQEAIAANLDLTAKGYYVTAGRQNVNEARSRLLPSIDLYGNYIVIDKDRAQSSMGQQAERIVSGSVTATQIIFSEPAWANFSIQKSLQKTRKYELEQLKLDITQDAATAYLNVLRAKTFERIEQENLKLTRQNLDLARVREMVGSAGPAEVFRWESEIASNRIAVINANAQRNLTEIDLNRLLHRPAEESFETQEIDLEDPFLITSYGRIFKYIENKQTFKIFRQFLVEESFRNSPELAALDAAIDVQERVLRSATNSFWSPTIALQGQLTNVFLREGEGTESFSIPELGFTTLKPKDLSWNVGLNLSFPLFSGGKKFAARQKALNELTQLRIERNAIAERIEQRVRSALHVSGASNASIEQAKLAAEAAGKSLRVVQDSYSQGLVSIVELLDAQYAALLTDQAAENALYDFLIDLMEVERAYGKFNFFSTDQKRKDFFEKANTYFEKAGIPIN